MQPFVLLLVSWLLHLWIGWSGLAWGQSIEGKPKDRCLLGESQGGAGRCKTLYPIERSVQHRRGFQLSYKKGRGIEMDLLGDGQWLIRVGADVYARAEIHTNRGDFLWSRSDGDEYVAARMRLNVEVSLMKQYGFRLVAQDARYWGNALLSDGGYIRFSPDFDKQLHREVFLGPSFFEGYLFVERPYGIPLRLEVGRKELRYGDGFLIGAPQYVPQGQSFDHAMLRWFLGPVELDLLWIKIRESLVVSDAGDCKDSCFFDGDDVYGLYGTYRLREDMQLDVYGMFFQRTPRSGEPLEMQRIGYLGVRFGVDNARWHVSLEMVGQYGTYRQKGLLAFAGLQKLRYTFAAPMRPFVGGQVLFASGDTQPYDDVDHNFVPLLPKRRGIYGLMNLVGMSNVIQPMIEVGFHPHEHIKVAAEARFSMKWAAESPFINGGGHSEIMADKTGNAGQILGWEVASRITWQPVPFFFVDLAGSIFIPQAGGILSFLKQTSVVTTGEDIALLGYLWVRMLL